MPPGKTPVPGKQWPALNLLQICQKICGALTLVCVFPKNPELADGVNPLPHGDPSQQDATAREGPIDISRRLEPEKLSTSF